METKEKNRRKQAKQCHNNATEIVYANSFGHCRQNHLWSFYANLETSLEGIDAFSRYRPTDIPTRLDNDFCTCPSSTTKYTHRIYFHQRS